uniref:Immunoglobulin V-set domain-containing protein n=1 Tax=Amphiprion percula TaxID=161767 RepID=A0A3P8TU18_AMPPE
MLFNCVTGNVGCSSSNLGPLIVTFTFVLLMCSSQNPSSVSYKRVNSSAEITCSTSLSDPLGVYLYRRFPSDQGIVYLAFTGQEITKTTINEHFKDRVIVTEDQPVRGGNGFTMQLSLLELEDTNLYYCSWTYFESMRRQTLSSNGTVIIVRGEKIRRSHSPITSKSSTFMSLIPFVITLHSLKVGQGNLKLKKTFKQEKKPENKEK